MTIPHGTPVFIRSADNPELVLAVGGLPESGAVTLELMPLHDSHALGDQFAVALVGYPSS